MPNKTITYHSYSQGDEKGIIELLKTVFPKWRQLNDPLGNWKWKYLEGPHPSDVQVAKNGEQIVGAKHCLMLDIKIGDATLQSFYGDDLAVHPDYREHRIWNNLEIMGDKTRIEKGIKFHYFATENPIVKENVAKLGFYSTHHTLSHLINIIDRESFLKKKKRDNLVMRAGVAALTGLSEVKQFFSFKPSDNQDFSIVDVARFDHRVDVFWEKVKDAYGYCIVKNADYLNWKQSRPSVSKSRIRLAVRGEEVLGFSTLSLREDGDYREGTISELFALPERLDVADALIGDACEHYNNEGAAAINYQVTRGHPYESSVKRSGFIDASSQKNTFFYYAIFNNSIPSDYFEKLHPSRVQLNYF